MEFLDLAKQRYSVRKFSHEEIEKEKLDRILEAGRIAPTAANLQPQRILVLQGEEDLAKLKNCFPFRFHESLALLVCYDKTASWKRIAYDNDDSGAIDAAIITTHMMMAATELGLGSVWIGHFDPQAVREVFALPDAFVPVAILLLGYPSVETAPHANHTKRFPLDHSVSYGAFPQRKE